ncbi:GGDEF domain-containing protein [Jeotgalibacillus salarius]|uniref:GGDEF domain-containing protein n=1 Tax=Jeotgalibacillus salarius TaxID=546023 RepID=A0A4Y8LRB2_9BACL|nr:diguanylate cyclase [Jeotgalibacillus salarius]TFE03999.1 GGDEF domain-containing protein [Jeotgalibacillus salarius]
MIRDFIINISIMISFTFVWHQLFKHNKLTLKSGMSLKVIDGLIAGVFGVMLMNFSLAINEITILDLRHVAIAMVALYGGLIPAMIASFVVIIGRYAIDINFSSHVALFMVLAIGLGTGLIGEYVKWSVWKKWTLMLVFSQSVFSLAFYIVSNSYQSVIYPAILHAVSAFAGGYLVLYFARYIRRATDAFYQVQENSLKDPLTDLYNVRAFDEYYNQFLKRNEEYNDSLGLLMIDIDYFKKINDNFGHAAGDYILKEIAVLLKEETANGFVSRNGGEEFTVIFPDLTFSQVCKYAESIRRKIDEYEFVIESGTSLHLTVSIGVSHTDFAPQQGLFESADNALYIAKQAGRNQVCSLCDVSEKQKEAKILSSLK